MVTAAALPGTASGASVQRNQPRTFRSRDSRIPLPAESLHDASASTPGANESGNRTAQLSLNVAVKQLFAPVDSDRWAGEGLVAIRGGSLNAGGRRSGDRRRYRAKARASRFARRERRSVRECRVTPTVRAFAVMVPGDAGVERRSGPERWLGGECPAATGAAA